MLTKTCMQCGVEFPKKYAISRKEWETVKFCSQPCKAASQKGKPHLQKPRRKTIEPKFLPCRICGKPTKYHGTSRSHLFGQVHCGNDVCADESRRLKNSRIAVALNKHVSEYGAFGHATWKGVSTISSHETAFIPWFESMGWCSQYHFITGVHSYKLPRLYLLDFALPTKRLCVEIDGTSHLSDKARQRDARKDQMLADRGWQVLRISTSDIDKDPAAVRLSILEFIGNYSRIRQHTH